METNMFYFGAGIVAVLIMLVWCLGEIHVEP